MAKEMNEKQSSIKVNKTSTNKYSFEVKIYFDDDKDKYGDDTILQLQEIYKKLEDKFKVEENGK